ncbi:MAG: FkbM family methyltransferase [Oscillospiraceae bacterium]|jgi:FkbM family methyltransferase|nr:FkbM family methyltransferase [Oscillospiraceae bacterium]
MSFSKIKSRLPGGELFKLLFKYKNVKISRNNPLETALLERRKYYKNRYFFGYKKETTFYLNLYKVMCDLFTDSSEQSWFDFNGVIIPKPISNEEKTVLMKEIIDFLIFDLTENRVLCDIVTNEGPYELDNVQILKGDIVIDCGANMGLFSSIASHKLAIAYAFEPSDYLINNYLLKISRRIPNINICKYALSHETAELEFMFSDDAVSIGHLDFIGHSVKNDNFRKYIVQAITLDDFIHENNIPKVDFIKADIEGAERYMLMGAKQVLKDFAPKLAICTYHLPDDPKVLREIILDANPKYIIEEKFKKIYAHVPN